MSVSSIPRSALPSAVSPSRCVVSDDDHSIDAYADADARFSSVLVFDCFSINRSKISIRSYYIIVILFTQLSSCFSSVIHSVDITI